MSDFRLACTTAEVSTTRAKNINMDGVEIAIFQTATGYVARSGVCKHNAFKFELCEVSGDVVRCPLHSWSYKISSGKGIKPSWTNLEHYPLELRGDEIWVKPEEIKEDKDDFDTSSYQW